MKETLDKLIKEYVKIYPEKYGIETRYKEPLIAYADAQDKRFLDLKEIVSPTHAVPGDFICGARTVIAYFLPFDDHVNESNVDGYEASRKWAEAYIETNKLIQDINVYVRDELLKYGYNSSVIPSTHNFNKEKLISDWSHRHVAYIAGLGSFGINNMLITDKGCCGRIGTIVTDLYIKPNESTGIENCLYKRDGSCRECVEKCVTGALKTDGFDRFKCYRMCLHNDMLHSDLGTSDVCGKCLVGIKCSTVNPAGNI